MPTNAEGTPMDPADINRFDGFSPGNAILVKVPGLDTAEAMAATSPVGLEDLAAYKAKKAPIAVLDAKTGKRWPIWAELDANANTPDGTLLLVHPAKNFREGRTYVVVLRNLRDGGGDRIKAGAKKVTAKAVKATLKKAKIGLGGVYRAWRFTVASEASLTGRMLHIRDDAFKQLGDTNLADMAVAGTAPKFTVTETVEYTPEQDARIAKKLRGTFEVPCYLDKPGCPPGAKFNLDPVTGLPVQTEGNVMTAPFECNVPRAASAAAPARLSLYGHGLLGRHTEIDAGNVKDMSNEFDFVFCATKWAGMSNDDIANAIGVLQDGSNFPTVGDRLQQGMLAMLYLGRLMIHPDGLPANAAFAGIVDTTHLYFDGNSQGGIMGGALTAYAPDYTRAVLGVPGMNYSVLLNRSVDWDLYASVFNPAYPDEASRPLVLSLLQLMWDRGEANGSAWHMTTDPLPNTPAHQVLLHPAVGDHQVSNFQAEVEARTIGARVRRPAAAAGRIPGKGTPPWGIPAIKTMPYAGSALVYWDSGPGNNAVAPIPNLPPREGEDPHEHPRATPAARQQKSDFLRPDGRVTEVCGADPCRTAAYVP
jgi:hypothetical protein